MSQNERRAWTGEWRPGVLVLGAVALGSCRTVPPTSQPAEAHRSVEASLGPGWIALFDGETLDGWHQVGGQATYRVEDGAIVGAVGPGPNSFLRTDGTFADFELRLEILIEEPGNSGIQFRSHQRPDDGRVFGYQCEVDPSERAWSGGVYDEGRRGWLYELDGPLHEDARAALRLDGWNTYVIRAEGSVMRTWLNGVKCAELVDDADDEGFIALQVHSGEAGRFRWRNVVIRELE